MESPNTSCGLFCDFLLTKNILRITKSQRDLIAIVREAADSNTTISERQWIDFINSTQRYFKVYKQYLDLFS
jgi:hypothetical protein